MNLNLKDLKVNDTLIFTGNFCLSYKKELTVTVITPDRIIVEDMRGSVYLRNAEQLSDYILKK